MKKIISLIFIIFPSAFLAQETKIIVQNGNGLKEIYSVLASNESIKQGRYQKIGYKGKVLIDGFYKRGFKDSTWIEYDRSGKNKRSAGNYADDIRVGVWEFYDFKGELEQKIDFTKNELLYFKLEDTEKEYKVISGNDTIKTKLDRSPLFIGGSTLLADFISWNTHYPQDAKENMITGRVYIDFIIDAKGKTSNYKILRGIGSGCDEEALRVVKIIPDNWIPGLLNGQSVNVEYTMPISFSLR